jgi:hypothetical protein
VLGLSAEQPLIRWAASVIGSSTQYGSPAYGAVQALGEPNVFPDHDDDARAWASATADGRREFLALGYDDAIQAAGVAIFETYNPGAVDRVEVRNAGTGEWVPVWSGNAAAQPPEARVFMISFPLTSFLVDGVRIELDSPSISGWNEIDAVALLGSDPADTGPAIGPFTVTSAGADALYSELSDEPVTGRVILTDYLHGVAAAELQLIDAAGMAVGPPAAASPRNTFDPVHYRKEWSGTVLIPEGTPTGLYGLRIRAVSNGGGESVTEQVELFTVTDTLPRPEGHYQFTKVIEIGEVGHSFGGKTYVVRDFGVNLPFSAPLINRVGDIAFPARLRDQNNIFASAAYLQSGTTRKVLANSLATGFSGRPSSLNDAGWVSFVGSEEAVPLSQGIYKSNGDETVLIDDTPNIGGYDPAINNHGVVVYRRPVPDTVNWELWKGDGLTRQKIFANTDVNANNGSGHLVVSGGSEVTMNQTAGFPRIDDHGRVYFWADVRAGSESLGVIARTRPGQPLEYLVTSGRNRLYDTIVSGFGITLNGRIVLGALSKGSSNAAIPAGGWEWVDIMGGTYLIGAQGRRYARIGDFFAGAAVGTVSINDSGRLAYLEYAGPNWELRSSVAPNRSILRPNHFLEGRRVQSVYLSWQAISQRDEIACLVVFTDGHQAIYRASPLTSGGADFARQPDGVLTPEPGGFLQYTFENVASGSWVELPPRGTVTITSPNAQGRITQLLGISDHLANRAEVLVNGAVVGTLAPAEPFNLVAATGTGATAVTLRGLTVSAARPQPLAVRLLLNNPTLDLLQLDGAGVPLLIQPPLRAHRANELLTLASGAVDPEGFAFQWSREATGPLVDDERTSGAESGELQIYPYLAEDAGLYTLAGTGSDGTVTVNTRVVNAVPFAQWAASFFPGQEADDQITGPDATPLNDGIPNLVKYAFGMDPTQPMTAVDHERIARVSRVIPGEETRLELRLLLHPAAVDVGLALESSPDPAAEAWTVLGAQELAVQENLTAAGRELNVQLPPVGGQAQFYRLRLVYSPPL